MRLNQFEFLVALDRYKSFSKVSKILLISQPSISRAIKEFEEELGFDILIRKKNGIEFTAEGELLLEKAKNVMAEIESIIDIKIKPLTEVEGNTSIGTSSHFCSYMMYEVFTSLKREYLNFFIRIINSDIGNIIETLKSNELDLGIIQFNSVDESVLIEIQENNLRFNELHREEMKFIVREEHPLAYKKEVTMEEILKYPYVTAKKSAIKYLLNIFRKYGFSSEITHITDISMLRRFIKTSNATCLISKSAARESNNIFEDKLVTLSISDYEWSSRIGWIHNENALSSAEEIIINKLVEYCQSITLSKRQKGF